jgi:hypothetical protein
MANTILFIFEGEKTEKRIFDKVKKRFFRDSEKHLIIAAYKTDIYQLWQAINEDEFLDIVGLLRERGTDIPAGISREDIDQIYMFFDYDGHATGASDSKIQEMQEKFNNETEDGMLYISYPMVEAFRDICNEPCFKDNFVDTQIGDYKSLVGSRSDYNDIRKLKNDDWDRIMTAHLCKANFIANNQYLMPNALIFQNEIFRKQAEMFIGPYNKIAVLSAFPMFVAEYFGLNIVHSPPDKFGC